MSIDPGWPVGLALALLLAVALGAHRVAGYGLERPVLVAAVRAIAQLGLAAVLIAAVVDSLPWSIALVCVMFAMGVLTTVPPGRGAEGLVVGRAGDGRRGAARCWPSCWPPARSRRPGIAVIPVAGIIVGNAMTAHTLVGRRAFAALREEHSQYEASLSVGLLPRQAIREIVHRRAPEALLPGLDQVKTTGVVTLPGAFIGVMLGGGTPAQAATAQVLVLFGIMAAQTVTVLVAEHLLAGGGCCPTTSPPAWSTEANRRTRGWAATAYSRSMAAPPQRDLRPFALAGAVAVVSIGPALARRGARLAGPGRRPRRPVLRGRSRCAGPPAGQHLQQRRVRPRRAGHRLAGRGAGHDDRGEPPARAAPTAWSWSCSGPASAAMHATQSALGGHLDLLSMYLIAAFASSYAWTRVLGRGTGFFAVGFVAVVAVCELAERIPGHVPVVDIAANLAFGLFLLLALAGEAVLWRRGSGRRQVGWGLASAGALALAFAIWNLAKDGSSLCHPDSLLQGHAAWHLLCAVAAYALYRLYASERVSDAA